MRKTLLTTLLLSLLCAPSQGNERREKAWSVGYAQADITPEPGQVQMCGFGRERYASGSLAPLLTQAVVLRDQRGNTGVLITADILDFERVMVEAIRRAIGHRHGLSPKNIMLAASHTHWGPAVRFRMGFSLGAPNVWYMGVLEDRILACVATAMQNLSPATVEYGWMDFRGIGCNRRRPQDGKITWGPYEEGSFDGHTPILRIRRSPGYPGAMRDCLGAELPDTKAVFVQGCGGDAKIVHRDAETGKLAFSNDPKQAKTAGRKLARAVLAHLSKKPVKKTSDPPRR